ncbi:putative G-protein coupled receptor 25 [Discoglossus pictus]
METQSSSPAYYYNYTTDYDYNSTDYDNDNEPEEPCLLRDIPHAHWFLPALYSVFFLLGLLGNAMVIAVISGRRTRRADVFILNLAVSDLLFVLTLPLWASTLALGSRWPFGLHLCRASGFTIAITRCASSLLMVFMSVDRYIAVMGGQKMHPLRTQTCSVWALCTIWVVSVLTGVPALVFRQLNANGACVDSERSSFIIGLKMATILLTFVLPLAVVLFCYCSIAKRLNNYFGSKGNAITGSLKPRRGHSWLRIVSCIVVAYSLAWLPFNTINMVALVAQVRQDLSCQALNAIRQALSATAALAFANSCTNPVIYALLDAGFRRRACLALPRFLPNRCAVFLSSLHIWRLSAASGSAESGTFSGSS